MRKNTNGHGLLGSVLITAAVVGWIVLMVAFVFLSFSGSGGAGLAAVAIVGIYVLAGLAVIGGVCAALYQRWKEVKGGEEDEAKKY